MTPYLSTGHRTMNLQWCRTSSSTPSLPDSPTLPVSKVSLSHQLFMDVAAITIYKTIYKQLARHQQSDYICLLKAIQHFWGNPYQLSIYSSTCSSTRNISTLSPPAMIAYRGDLPLSAVRTFSSGQQFLSGVWDF